MLPKVSTFLMFDGKAEEAMNFYASLFKDASITDIKRYGPGEAGAEGSVMVASFSLGDQRFKCIDSPVKHDFGFTPAISLFVTCETEGEVETLVPQLAAGGHFLMPLGAYPFSRKFAWVADRYGVSWQIGVMP
jgi:predicted 3-demethylubiquinone-9 3-methyltransferase (glyoxalase superfamily)